MIISFEKLPKNARIWIYTASRYFNDKEKEIIHQKLTSFLEQWTAHNKFLTASFELPYNHFITIGLDESKNKISGCGIDKSVEVIKELDTMFNLNLLDKMNATFKQEEKIIYKSLKTFIELVKNKSISKNTTVFNNLVFNKNDYLHHWEVPAEKSWHKKYFE